MLYRGATRYAGEIVARIMVPLLKSKMKIPF